MLHFYFVFVYVCAFVVVSVNSLNTLFNFQSRLQSKKLTGCLQVIDTSGEPAWTKYSNILGIIGKKTNRSFQIFGSGNNFINLSEYLGPRFYATASGKIEQSKDDSNVFEARVTRIEVAIKKALTTTTTSSSSSSSSSSNEEWVLGFNVDGKGVINIVKDDGKVRIVENEAGARATQQYVPLPFEYESNERISIFLKS